MTQFDIEQQLISCGVLCTRCLQSVQKTEALAPGTSSCPGCLDPWERCWAKKHSKAKKAFAYSARNANQPFLCLAMWDMHELRGQIGELGNNLGTEQRLGRGRGYLLHTYNVARLICISLSLVAVVVVVIVSVVAVVVIFQIISAIQLANFSNV